MNEGALARLAATREFCEPHLSLKSLCGGGVPSSHPSLGLSVFLLSFTLGTGLGTGLARTGTKQLLCE